MLDDTQTMDLIVALSARTAGEAHHRGQANMMAQKLTMKRTRKELVTTAKGCGGAHDLDRSTARKGACCG
jgi:hypothetical protein